MTKLNPNNKNETKSEIFPCDIFKSDSFHQQILKHVNDLKNQN